MSRLDDLKQKIADALWVRDRYAKVFAGDDGQWVLNDILRRAGIGADPYVPGVESGTLYNVGRQSMGATIIKILNLSEVDVRRRILEQQDDTNFNQEDTSYDR